MVQAIINIDDHTNRILNIVKAKFGLKDKSQAIDMMAKEYEDEVLEPQLRPEFVEKMKKMALWGLTIPEGYGGSGSDITTYIIAVIELARCCGSTAGTFLIHCGVPTKCIWRFGTEEQKKKYLPPAAAGETLFAWGQTEPGSGSDEALRRPGGPVTGPPQSLEAPEKPQVLRVSRAAVLHVREGRRHHARAHGPGQVLRSLPRRPRGVPAGWGRRGLRGLPC